MNELPDIDDPAVRAIHVEYGFTLEFAQEIVAKVRATTAATEEAE